MYRHIRKAATPQTIKRWIELRRSSHPSDATAMRPAAMPDHAPVVSVDSIGFISLRRGDDRRSAPACKDDLPGSAEIAALTAMREIWNFHRDAILFLAQ